MKRIFLSTLIIGTICGTVRAQDIQVSLGDITDKRTTGKFFAECEIGLHFTGDALADSMGVRNIKVTTATDDTGRDLKPKEKKSSHFFHANKSGDSTL